MNIKKTLVSGIAGMMAVGAFAVDYVDVTNVVARQRYPWNGKVDIDFQLDSKATEPYQMKVEVFDNDGKTNLPVKSVCTPGVSIEANPCMVRTDTRHIVWDAAKDLPNGFKCTNVLVTCRDALHTPVDKLYCIINLTDGSKEYLNCIPSGGWTDEYKKTKMVFRRIEAGSFMMGSPESEINRQSNETQHKVTITKPYYIAVFELTEAQYCQVCGGSSVSMLPKLLTYGDIRGCDFVLKSDSVATTLPKTSYCWPDSELIDSNSLVGKLRSKTKIQTFDLPTEAKWELACRGMSLTALNDGNVSTSENMKTIGRYDENVNDSFGDASSKTVTTVGCYNPNAYGIYDMLGNAREWCVDAWNTNDSADSEIDPIGSTNVTLTAVEVGPYVYWRFSKRVVKGGGFYHHVRSEYSSYRVEGIDAMESAASLSECRSAWRSWGRANVANPYPTACLPEYTLEGVRLVFSAE